MCNAPGAFGHTQSRDVPDDEVGHLAVGRATYLFGRAKDTSRAYTRANNIQRTYPPGKYLGP